MAFFSSELCVGLRGTQMHGGHGVAVGQRSPPLELAWPMVGLTHPSSLLWPRCGFEPVTPASWPQACGCEQCCLAEVAAVCIRPQPCSV